MSEYIGLTHTTDCDACSLWKEVPLRNFLTYMDVFAWKFSHGSRYLYTTCYIISYVCARPTCFRAACRLSNVFTHTKIRVSVHFLSYELISMCNVKHMTPCLTPNFPQTSRNDVQPHDVLTYEPFYACNYLKVSLKRSTWSTSDTTIPWWQTYLMRRHIRQGDIGGKVTFDKRRGLGI